MTDSLSIFFPFYNDAGTVKFMISQAYQYGYRLTNDLEVIAVNDGSTDGTLNELTLLKKTYPQLKIINHTVNKGYGGALISGINNTTKKWVFYTDGDAQYHLDELETLWKLRLTADVINGYKVRRSDNALRQIAGNLYSGLIQYIFKLPIRDVDCDYRLMQGIMVRDLKLHFNSGAITVELIKKLALCTNNFKETGVNHYSRIYGQSTFFTPANIIKTFTDEIKLLRELKSTYRSDENYKV